MKGTAVVLGLWLAGSAWAQPAAFLVPESHSVRVGAPVSLRAMERRDGKVEGVDWPREYRWFYVRIAGTQQNRDAENGPKAAAEQPQLVSVSAPGPGVAMIGLDYTSRIEEWSGAQIAEFRGHAGRAAVEAEAPARVKRLVSATTLVRVTDENGSTGGDGTATTKAGQKVEIRMLMDPTVIEPGFDLAVRVYVEGDGVANARVIATHVESGAVQTVVCDKKGIGHFKVERAGAWRVEFHEFRELKEGEAAWVAASASTTFETPAKGGAR